MIARIALLKEQLVIAEFLGPKTKALDSLDQTLNQGVGENYLEFVEAWARDTSSCLAILSDVIHTTFICPHLSTSGELVCYKIGLWASISTTLAI